MKKAYKFLFGFILAVMSVSANAQNASKSEVFIPHFFWHAQAGAKMDFTPGDRLDLVSPAFGVGFGYQFNPSFGIRFGLQGLDSKVYAMNDYQKFHYLNTNVDLMFNISHLFSLEEKVPFTIYVLGGFGLNYSWGKDDMTYAVGMYDKVIGGNFRFGAMAEYELNDKLSLIAEWDVDKTSDAFNTRINEGSDWSTALKVGVKYNFGYSKTKMMAQASQSISTDAMSLYERMKQGANDRMNNWMKRLEGESDEAYKLRTSSDSIESIRLKFENEMATELAGNRINTSNATFGKYNTGRELLTVDFNSMPSIALSVPKEEVAAFQSSDAVQFRNTVYGLNKNNEFEVIYTEVLNSKNSKTYVYNNLDRKDVTIITSGSGYVPLNIAQQTIANSARLERIKTDAVQELKDEDIISDNTTISVSTEVVPAKTANGMDTYDYKVSYKYTVKDQFSVYDDFAPGKYDAEKAKASVAMMNVINKAFATDFAKYVKPGKGVTISYSGSADAMPINGVIKYDGKFGDVNNQAVNINGKPSTLTVTKESGITSNEQLSLIRAISVKDYVHKNISGLKDMKINNVYNIEISPEVGSEYRRVKVDFLFHDAF